MSGYLLPENFPHLDAEGFTQGQNNVPMIKHIHRHAMNETIVNKASYVALELRFSTNLPERETQLLA